MTIATNTTQLAEIVRCDFYLPNGKPAPAMLTVEEVCEVLGCVKTQLRSWHCLGILKRSSLKLARPYPLDEIKRFIKIMPRGQKRNK